MKRLDLPISAALQGAVDRKCIFAGRSAVASATYSIQATAGAA